MKFTEDQRAALDEGFAQILADREAREIEGHLPRLLATCVGTAPESKFAYGWTADPPRACADSTQAVPGPVRRAALRRAYDRAASFAGPLFIGMISGGVGLFLGAALAMRR
ncbi:hypothetical protein [Streptomyces sp. NPDC051546]|uniref:hypothetical protein n=1 Tax=Streptomyces sp. NPDC051546 TaxID=3365655 RepID=UPI0037B42BED